MGKICRLTKWFKSPVIEAAIVAFAATGCAHTPVMKEVALKGPVSLRLKAEPVQIAKSFYHSESDTHEYENDQKVKDSQELVDFSIQTEIMSVGEKSFVQRVEAVSKDGLVDLHSFAFPEVGQQIDFEYTYTGDVLKAGGYSPNSLYFVPPISLPDHPVSIGDTWAMTHSWRSRDGGIPLRMDMATIFKRVVSCAPFGQCADLELSGRVIVEGKKINPTAQFSSQIWGRVLFSIDRGDVIWSEVRSDENVRHDKSKTEVVSCMGSIMKEMDFKTEILKGPTQTTSCEAKPEVVPTTNEQL